MGVNQQSSSMDSAPMVRHHLIHEFHSGIPRISTSGDAIMIKADRKATTYLPRCNNLNAHALREKGKRWSTYCVAEEMKVTRANASREESSRGCDAEKESYTLTPFYSSKNGSSRKRLFTLLDMDDDAFGAPKFEETAAKYTPCLVRMEMDAIHGSSSSVFRGRMKLSEDVKDQNPSSPKKTSFGSRGLSSFAVCKWRTDSNGIGKNRESVQVKKDYRFNYLPLAARSKDGDSHLSSLDFLFPDNRKVKIGSICGFPQEETGNSLHNKGEMPKSMWLDSSNGEKMQTLTPSWSDKCVTEENMNTTPGEEVCDGRGPKLPPETRRSEPCGAVDKSPYCNRSSNFNWAEHPPVEPCDEQKDKKRSALDASRIDCHSSPSATTDSVETGSLQSDRSSKGLTSWHLKKHAKLDANKEGCCKEATSAPTSISNKTTEHDLLASSEEETLCCSSGNIIHAADMEIILPKAAATSTSGEGLANSHGMPLEDDAPPQPSNGWVKRLKVHSMDSLEPGTRSSSIRGVPISGGVKKLCSRVQSHSKLALASHLHHRKMGSSSINRPNSQVVESLKRSQPWIRRWCHYSSRRSGAGHLRECRKEGWKMASESLEGKQLIPSIAAIALMGKAANGSRACEFRRRGASLVWNTEGF